MHDTNTNYKICPRYYTKEKRKEVQKTDPDGGTVTTVTLVEQTSIICTEACALYEFRPRCGAN